MSYKRSLFKFALISIVFIFLVNIDTMVNSQVVCSLDELIKELYEDIVDNGN